MRLRTLDDLPNDLTGKRVFLRLNWDVPRDAKGNISPRGLFKMRSSVPTITELRARHAVVAMATYWERPGGKVVPALSLRRLLPAAQKLLRARIGLLPLPPRTRPTSFFKARPGALFLFENVRFHPDEEKNSPQLAAAYAQGFDYFINDAFASAHRAHTSIAGVARLLPAVAGRLLEQEVTTLSLLIRAPRRPFVILFSGAKVSTKFGVLRSLLKSCDSMLVGGGIANTLLLAAGIGIGSSLAEPALVRRAPRSTKIILPRWDAVVSREPKRSVHARIVNIDHGEIVRSDEWMVDIGPRTLAHFRTVLQGAKTILWNGPFGVNEVPRFTRGTDALARAVAAMTGKATTVVGGGDTMDVVERLGIQKKFSFCSTGGGAMLEFLEGKKLPGIVVLLKK